jgi:ABC-type branched-subunit amino acid transport system substrate-binding protein
MIRSILKKLRTSLVLITVIGLCCLGAFAISRQWEGLSAIAYYLIAIISLPPAIIEVFPSTIHHVHRIVRAVLCITAAAVVVFAITFLGAFSRPPVYKIAISLPFTSDSEVAATMYNAMHDNFEHEGAVFTNSSQTRMQLHGKLVELVPFDDAKIGDTDCTVHNACEITVYDNSTSGSSLDNHRFTRHTYFSELLADPQLVAIIGPYNSGVALRELPAVNKAHVPLISPANTADCLTDPGAANRDCDVKQIGEGSYFRTVTPDSLRQKVMADYLWEHWRDCPYAACTDTPQEPRVVVFRESGPQASTFSEGSADAFIKAWSHHTNIEPTTYPIADNSTDGNLRNTIRRLTVRPNIVIYTGTGKLGGKLYDAFTDAGYTSTVFAGPGSIRDTYTVSPSAGSTNPLFAADFATLDPSGRIPGVEYKSIYAACAFDATGMLLRSLFATQQQKMGVSNYRLTASIDRAISPLPFNTTGAFRDTLIHTLRWVNTTNNVSYHGLTGTYSFNGGDTAGATGVTISQFLLGSGVGGTWVAVNAPVSY